MPVSKKRKKKGKKVGNGKVSRVRQFAERPSGVSLQDLINVLAYQEYVKDGSIVADDAKVTVADPLPVTIEDADGNKIQVGTAERIPGDPNALSIKLDDIPTVNFEDPKVASVIQALSDASHYSISEETEDER